MAEGGLKHDMDAVILAAWGSPSAQDEPSPRAGGEWGQRGHGKAALGVPCTEPQTPQELPC